MDISSILEVCLKEKLVKPKLLIKIKYNFVQETEVKNSEYHSTQQWKVKLQYIMVNKLYNCLKFPLGR